MSVDPERLKVSLEQMERLLVALEDLRQSLLPHDPTLFATMAEAPLEDLARIRRDLGKQLHELKPTG